MVMIVVTAVVVPGWRRWREHSAEHGWLSVPQVQRRLPEWSFRKHTDVCIVEVVVAAMVVVVAVVVVVAAVMVGVVMVV